MMQSEANGRHPALFAMITGSRIRSGIVNVFLAISLLSCYPSISVSQLSLNVAPSVLCFLHHEEWMAADSVTESM
jgi:hypothetical protein